MSPALNCSAADAAAARRIIDRLAGWHATSVVFEKLRHLKGVSAGQGSYASSKAPRTIVLTSSPVAIKDSKQKQICGFSSPTENGILDPTTEVLRVRFGDAPGAPQGWRPLLGLLRMPKYEVVSRRQQLSVDSRSKRHFSLAEMQTRRTSNKTHDGN